MIYMFAGIVLLGLLEGITGKDRLQKHQGGTLIIVGSFLIIFKFLQMWFG